MTRIRWSTGVMCLWQWDRTESQPRLSPSCSLLLGLPPDEPELVQKWLGRVAERDRRMVAQVLDTGGAASTEIEYEYLHPERGVLRILTRTDRIHDRTVGGNLDVTQMRETEENYRAYLELNPQVPWIADPDGGILDFNQRWLELTGLSREQALGAGWLQVPHPDDLPGMAASWQAAVTTGSAYDVEHRIRLANGSYRWMRSRAWPRRNEAGEILRWYGTTEDIHDRKLAQDELKESEARYRLLTEAIPQLVWSSDGEGRLIDCNQRWLEYTGQAPQDAANEGWTQLIHPADLARTAEQRALSTFTGQSFSVEYRMRRHDGEYRWHLAQALPLRDAAGRIVRWFGTCTDVDDLKRAQADLKERTEYLALAQSASGIGFWDWDIFHDTATCTPQYLRLHGLSTEIPQTQLRDWHSRVHPEDRQQVEQSVQSALKGDGHYSGRYRVVDTNGRTRWLTSRGTVLRDLTGKPYRMLGATWDETERIAAESRLRAANAELIRANDDLRQFARATSHDLNEPLRMVVTFTQMLERHLQGQLDENARTYMRFAGQGARRIIAMLAGLRDYWLATERPHREPQELSPAGVIDRACDNLDVEIRKTGARIEPGELPNVLGDPSALVKVFQNLIDNAIKFRDPVRSPLVRIQAAQREGFVVFEVIDNGVGFETQYADQIFEMFKRLSTSGPEGAGLGLAVCRRLVEQQGGKIGADSVPGKGSIFRFSLPRAEPKHHIG